MAYINRMRHYLPFETIYVLYISTDWEGKDWLEKVSHGEDWAKKWHFVPLRIAAPSFQSMMIDRGEAPSPKFQWCSNFLKGIPFINWLDKLDKSGSWSIAYAKRQSATRVKVLSRIEQCEYHGDRQVINPIAQISNANYEKILEEYNWSKWPKMSQECAPCINSNSLELAQMKKDDINKTNQLEKKIRAPFFPKSRFGNQETIVEQSQHVKNQIENFEYKFQRDKFNRGCGDIFGCGL